MKIHKLYIAAFGGLKEKTIEFSDGFNVIYGENENGKTTVMNFIKMMFYGNPRGSSQIAKNPRKKYTPWDGSPMAGSIEFEQDGRSYRLEREFKSSNATDKVTLCDLSLGTRQTVAPDIGSKIFGLSAAAFERSVFLAEPGGIEKDAEAEGEINARLSNMVGTGDESVSYHTVHARLEKAQQTLMSKRKVGEYDKNERAIAQAQEELRRAEQIFEEYEEFKAAAAKASALLAGKAKTAMALKQKIEGEQDARNAGKMRELLDIKEELDRQNRAYALSDGGVMDEVFVKKLDFCLKKAEDCRDKLDSKQQEAERLAETVELALHPSEEVSPQKEQQLAGEIARLESELAEIRENAAALAADESENAPSRNGAWAAWLIAGLIALAAAGTLLFLAKPLLAVFVGVAALSCGVAGLLLCRRNGRKAREYANKQSELQRHSAELVQRETKVLQEISNVNLRLTAIRAALGSNAAVVERQKEQLAVCRNEIAQAQEALETEEAALFDLFGRYRSAAGVEEIRAALPELEKAAQEQKELKNRLRYLARDLGNPSYEAVREKLQALPEREWNESNFEEWKLEYEALLAEISEKKAALSAAKARAQAQLSGAKQPEILKKEIAELRRVAASQKEFYEAAALADEILGDSFALLRKRYGSALEKKAGEIFAGLTAGRYEALQISKAFEIFTERQDVFGAKESAYLSSGTEDQAYLSMRLALSELIFENAERMPLMLDDVLARYDDARMEAAIAYLSAFAGQNQVLFFTCHLAVCRAAEKQGAKAISPLDLRQKESI